MYHADLMGLLVGKLAGLQNIVWNIRHSNLEPKINKNKLFWLLNCVANYPISQIELYVVPKHLLIVIQI